MPKPLLGEIRAWHGLPVQILGQADAWVAAWVAAKANREDTLDGQDHRPSRAKQPLAFQIHSDKY